MIAQQVKYTLLNSGQLNRTSATKLEKLIRCRRAEKKQALRDLDRVHFGLPSEIVTSWM